jgi:hypothetical protein
MAFGTLTSFETLATTQQSVVQVGEDRVWEALETALAAHNQQFQEAVMELAEPSTDRRRRYGGPDTMQMQEGDEFSTPDAQKVTSGSVVEFPLRKFQIGQQWTRDYLLNTTPGELAAQITAIMDADVQNLHLQLKKALFFPTNYTFEDRFVDHVDLAVKRLVNADGAIIPVAPDGTSFNGSSHTHYLGTAAFAAADLTAGVNTVNEHFLNGKVQIYIAKAQEGAVSGFTGFTKFLPNTLVAATNAISALGTLDVENTNNREIGDFNGSTVWVKPWIPSGYVLFIHKSPAQKALVWRTRRNGSGTLENVFENDNFPLRNKGFQREFGFGVYNRVAAAVLYTGGASYTAPTL